MKKILFYTPFSRRARDVESVILALKAHGYDVISLSQANGDVFNHILSTNGVRAMSYVIPGSKNIFYYLRHLIYLVRFCRREQISVIFSHLDSANFVASLAQSFIKAKVFLCRHHIDEAMLYNFHSSWTYRLTNRLTRRVIAVSQASIRFLNNVEHVPIKKVIHINLAYDFSLYQKPDQREVALIQQKFHTPILLLTACRLTQFKRPDLSIAVVEKLRANGLDVSLVVLGEGDMKRQLEEQVREKGLSDLVRFEGHVTNANDYIAACTFVVHPSVLESSCVLVKEAGLFAKPVIVCEGIGDFDEYMVHDKNGFVVSKDHFVNDAVDVIMKYGDNVTKLHAVGKDLSSTVHELFDIKRIFPKYLSLLEK